MLIEILFLLFGAVLALLAGIGVWRLPDAITRMHAATKVGVLGAIMSLVAVAIHFGDAGVVGRCLLAIALILGMTPVAAHLFARAVFRTPVLLWEKTSCRDVPADLDENDEATP